MFIPSPVYHKVRLNMKLTNEEENEVRKAMRESFNKLKAVESETARLRERLVVLSQKKKDAEDFIKLHQGLLSPIRRLHPEILQDIFCRCLPIAHNSVLSFKKAPLLLGRVCRQRRLIAYSTPALWSSLHINPVPLTSPEAKARFEAFNVWLSHSGKLPLSISMSTSLENDIFSQEIRPYFNLVVKYARRWKYIHLHVEVRDLMPPLEINVNDLPLLEVFHIEVRYTTARSLLKKHGILSAPLLRVLSIQDFSLRLLDLPVQWSKLTGLDSTYSNLSELFTLLSLCSNLEACALNVEAPYHPPFSTIVSESSKSRLKIILPKLRTLAVYGVELTHDQDLLFILNDLFAPALRHFACELSNWSSSTTFPGILLPDYSSWSEVFSSFFQRLDEPLEELDFRAHGHQRNYLMELFSLSPALKRLSLKCSSLASGSYESLPDDHLLLEFIPYEQRSHCHSCSLVEEPESEQAEVHGSVFPSLTGLCPNLEVLRIDGASFSKHTLFEFLHSRLVDYDKYDIARLRRFSISYNSGWDDDDMTKIDRIAEKSGLPVKVEYSPAPTPQPWPLPVYRDPFIQELPAF